MCAKQESMSKMLEPTERETLIARHKNTRDKREADRIKVVLLVDDGWSYVQIAKALFIDESTVCRHLEAYASEQRLKPNHKGSKPLLTEAETSSLSAHLEDTLYVKVKEIRTYVQQTYGKQLSRTAVYEWLKRHNFVYKKPKLVPAKADPEKQAEFIARYEKLMNQAAIEGNLVLFGDSVHPSQQTRVAYGWVKKGKEKLLESTGARKRVNLMGALGLEEMNFVYESFETINGEAAVKFLQKLETTYPHYKKIHLIWDRAGYHTCEEVKEYLKTSRIKVHYLPPRSPNLNAIERLWKITHSYVSNNKCYTNFAEFKKALFAFFDVTMVTIYDELVSSITDNFQIVGIAK